ncbi:hypothetical protein F4821DRAFT_32183 [Hypoxylon rubiginosum]|uniref:Uncharacterized protein n=1 Tax=Hypoxylon rubiginosum TaxID=110542 RepID=A0ACC0CLW4_9PEZI|nr:hypothetical protein F4821DRAFT_32183 [Hypoxylon rubiginosum]
MHFSTAVKFIAMAAPIFVQSASGWSFTAYDAEGCRSTETAATPDRIQKTEDVVCDPVPNAASHKSIRGDIAANSDCRINFYPSEGCGDRVAFSLTKDTTTCLSIADFFRPLAYYKATGCQWA